MAESTRLVDLVHERIARHLAEQRPLASAVSDDLDIVMDVLSGLVSRGKRFRALFCYWGWQSVHGMPDPLDPMPAAPTGDQLAPVVTVAAGLELFHAAALVHDDIMDNSDTRRGAPSVHRRFEAEHVSSAWAGDAESFGRSAALLSGDLLLAFADELVTTGALQTGDAARTLATRSEFDTMRRDVTLGQYLDILEEHSWLRHDDAELLPRAQRVIVYKSAKYSIEAPLLIGAALAGASAAQSDALSGFGLPLGIAYQLRDDLLGVFGDPAETGKPAGDDLREGKRTVLVAIARAGVPGNVRNVLDELLGDPDLDDAQIALLRGVITDSGAVERVERIIAHQVSLALAALADAPLAPAAIAELNTLAHAVTTRTT